MPGSGHHLPKGTTCDLHPDQPAVARIQGETDSMGAELNDMCQACLDAHRKHRAKRDTSGICDWCKKQVERRGETRDYDEGLHGPLYMVCQPCVQRRDQRLQEELDRDRDRWGYE